MNFRRVVPSALVLLVVMAPAAFAFTDAVHQDVAEQAARLMPTSLRHVLAHHVDELRAGATAPLPTDDAGLFLYPDGSRGTLDEAVQRQTQRVLDALARRSSMGVVVREMGVLSHLVALGSDPLHVTEHDARTRDWGPQFEQFVESRLPRMRVVFGGYDSPALDRDDVPSFVQECAARTRLTASLLPRMYILSDGSVARDSAFDDRHPVFGVASLAHAHAITDTARLWLFTWIKSNGDASGLPFPQALPSGQVAAQAP
jgi:hypothetical protein